MPTTPQLGPERGRGRHPEETRADGLVKLQMPWLLPSPAASPPRRQCSSREASAPAASEKPGVQLLVMKFGGSSLAGAEALQRVAGIVRERLAEHPVLVLSAMGTTTNMLLAAAERAVNEGEADISPIGKFHREILQELGVQMPADAEELLKELERIMAGVGFLREVSHRTRDRIVSFGERLSVRIFAAVFNKDGAVCRGKQLQARAMDSWEIGMTTSSGAGSATSAFSQVEVLPATYHEIATCLQPLEKEYSHLPVITGYIGKDTEGTITTLGRDGSDLTATIIGASVQAKEIQIWKDVDGILTTDPRLVPGARPVTVLTFEEAAELSNFGAKVVHPAAVLPAWLAGVPMSVRNSALPTQPGTRIVAELAPEERVGRVVAMSSKRNITIIVIRSTRMLGQHGFLAHVFQVFEKFQVSVDVIATSEVTVSLTLDQGYKPVDVSGLCKELMEVAKVEVKEAMAMLTLITAKKDSCSVLREAFDVFDKNGVEVELVSHGASNVNVTFVLPESSFLPCTQQFHKIFFESAAGDR